MHANAFVRAFMRVPIKSVANKNETKLNQRDNNWMHKHIEQSYEKPTEIIFFFILVFCFSILQIHALESSNLSVRAYTYISIHTYTYTYTKHKKKTKRKKNVGIHLIFWLQNYLCAA